MRKHYSIRVSGKVQGVYFRASTEAKARELGISGFVRNERDGSVYIEAEGAPEILERFVTWCHQGPERAQVKSCNVEEGSLKNFTGFSIER